ncbi:MAG: Lon-like protease helical domain-containing protein, partial [Candidatus Binatia bacterium]
MTSPFVVPAERLRWRCEPSLLPSACTSDMIPLEDFIGQERAIRAIEFGLGVDKPGFNIFVTGLTGTGKTTIIKAFLKKVTAEKTSPEEDSPFPEDWCYVYNFSDADRPQVLKIPRGWGKILRKDMEGFIHSVRQEVKKTFESEEFARQRQSTIENMQRQHQGIMEAVVEEARKSGFALRVSAAGMAMIPLTEDGKPMQEGDYLTLPAEQRKVLEERRGEIEKRMDGALREGKKLEREISDKLESLDQQAGEYLVRIPLSDLKERYKDY